MDSQCFNDSVMFRSLKGQPTEEVKVTFDSTSLNKLYQICSGNTELIPEDYQFLKEMEWEYEAKNDESTLEMIQKRLIRSDKEFIKRADYHNNFCDTRE